MGSFSELAKYKDTIMLKLLENSNLVKALTSNDSNFLDSILPEDTTTLLYTQIFPHRKVDSKINETKSYITMVFEGFRPLQGSTTIQTGKITFYVLCHNEIVRTNEGLRYDYILEQIDNIFGKSRGMGIGKLQLLGAGDFMYGEASNYMGCYVTYNIVDFQ